MACSSAGLANSPRQAMTASPAVITAASPTVAQPPAVSMSRWANARAVSITSHQNPRIGTSLSRSPRRKLRLGTERSGARANRVGTATTMTPTRYPTGMAAPFNARGLLR
jgi:hypothetical protein